MKRSRGGRSRASLPVQAPATPSTPANAATIPPPTTAPGIMGAPATTAAINAPAAPAAPAAGRAGARIIRGPQSALTDFLASHNISALQIRQDANARRAAALASQQADNGEAAAEPSSEDEEDEQPIARHKNESKARFNKRKEEEQTKLIAKIKAKKSFKRRREALGSDADSAAEDEAARAMLDITGPLPDQLANCAICDKRFTVTGYTQSGPEGGLLCPTCTKELNKEKGVAKRKKRATDGRRRRQLQSNLLDGIYPGAKSLLDLSVATLANNIEDADDLGDIPIHLVDKLSAILSKRRLINSKTLNLFLKPSYDSVTIFDGAKLSHDDYIRIFQIVPKVKHVRLRNAVQFKNVVMDHVLATHVELESLSLHGANLIDDERWDRFFQEKGLHLRSLKVYHMDGHFGDEQLELLPSTCPELQRLKVCHNQKVTDAGLSHIAKLSTLQHLSLEITHAKNHTTSEPYAEIINAIGPGLRTLSLANVLYIDDSILKAIHDNCQNLSKLRITDNQVLTDKAFADLFTEWHNPGLKFVDLHKCRHLDSLVPRDNPNGIGFASLGFAALMAHSRKNLQILDLNSCRHISRETFEVVFDVGKIYPELREMNLSFCQSVNDFVVGCIFRSCPKLKTLKVFGNFGVRDIKVPKGRILIGVPNALGMQIEGHDDEDEGRVI